MSHENMSPGELPIDDEAFRAMMGREPVLPIETHGDAKDESPALEALGVASTDLKAEIDTFVRRHGDDLINAIANIAVNHEAEDRDRYLALLTRISDIDDVCEGLYDVTDAIASIESAEHLNTSDKEALLRVLGLLIPEQ